MSASERQADLARGGEGDHVASPLVMMSLTRLVRLAQERQWSDRPAPAAPQVVCIRPAPPEGARTPLVFVHPIGGSIVAYRDIARELRADRAVYGIQSQPDETRNSLGHADLAALAADYADQVCALALGPRVVLSGYSLGGALAYEMARILESRGVQVEALLIIDTPARVRPQAPGGGDAVTGAQLRMFGQMLAGAGGARLALDGAEFDGLPAEAAIERLIGRLREHGVVAQGGAGMFHDVYRLVRHNEALQRAHLPAGGYQGRVTLIRTEGETPELRTEAGALCDEPAFGWQAYCARPVRVRHVPGTHFQLIYPPYIAGLARALQACLDELAPPDLLDLFAARAAARPHHAALRHGERSVDYAALQGAAAALALRLQLEGAGPGQVVGICAERGLDHVTAMLAVLMSGAAYLPLDPCQPWERTTYMLADADPVVVLASGAHGDALRDAGRRVLVLDGCAEVPAPAPAAPASAPAGGPARCAYVMYTSGTTGVPKGVRVTCEAIVRLASDPDFATLGPDCVTLQHASLCFDAATFEIWGSLLTGGTCVLMPHARPSLQQYEQVIAAHGVTTTFFTASLFRELAERRPQALRGMREVLVGGDVVSAASVRRAIEANPGLQVVHAYGPTECTVFALAHRFDGAHGDPALLHDPLPLGLPVADATLHVLDADLRPVADGAEGELFIGGRGLALGYLNRPDLTAAAFVEIEDAHGGRQVLYRSGDRVQRGADGLLRFLGRADRQVKVRGHRVELGEIDAVLLRQPALAEAVVRALPAGPADKALVVYAVPSAGAIAPDAVRDARLLAERTAHWEQVYSKLLYKSLASADQGGSDPTMNTAGWKSSYDGRQIPDEHMDEQIAAGVANIMALAPRHVLEIGCGTGMLLFRVAPRCASYTGTDFSGAAIDYVRSRLAERDFGQVTLHRLVAHELPPAPPGGFDTVILNSVTEHFPSLDYLDDLLRRLPDIMAPGGHVYVGDNRNAALLRLFHGAVQLYRSDAASGVGLLASQAELATMEETQLTIAPDYFRRFDDDRLRCVSIACKRGRLHNEMTQFRLDVVLRAGGPADTGAAPEVRAWRDGEDTLAGWATALAEAAALPPSGLLLTGLPNARVPGAALLVRALGDAPGIDSVGELRRAIAQAPAGEDPEAWQSLGAQLGCQVRAMPGEGPDARFDVLLWRGAAPAVPQPAPRALASLANDPLLSLRTAAVSAALRDTLTAALPQYAVPHFIVMMPRFVLTANGKVDMGALPLPQRLRRALAGAEASSPLEGQVAAVWENVLDVGAVGADEDFFAIGGDSLKAVRVAAELGAALGQELSPALLFEHRTVASLAAALAAPAQPAPAPAASGRGEQRRAVLGVRGARRAGHA